jgi:hypothetical protein
MNREQLYSIDPILVNTIENLLFKEKTHLKRGMGFTTVPEKLLLDNKRNNNLDIKEEIKAIFIRHFL